MNEQIKISGVELLFELHSTIKILIIPTIIIPLPP